MHYYYFLMAWLPAIIGAAPLLLRKRFVSAVVVAVIMGLISWGCAIAEAMGYGKDVFLSVYTGNIDSQNSEVLGEHIEAELLRAFMEDKTEWTGTMSELYELLKKDVKGGDDFPKTSNALSRKLNSLKINLEEAGIQVIKNKGTRRSVTIRKVPANIVNIADIVADTLNIQPITDDAPDDVFESVPESSIDLSMDHETKDEKDDIDDDLHDF